MGVWTIGGGKPDQSMHATTDKKLARRLVAQNPISSEVDEIMSCGREGGDDDEDAKMITTWMSTVHNSLL